ncbi:hypothetical protein SARC_00753 [Sphaeroforma arctica JP610]|uniref:Mitochondrial 2-oxoglutarate/malate carrier protein n=1 Tax=Sphaeroforma arctica JP610 TaxID=667725 RepID=A0A0L0GDQ3_9EUKA|nr:hypothetical protein SARC_00753 [Sphaeroforma arctica JP610]KNC87130.1 hypothetical protein SARC_00753 [Sphaeroforma arctica JP610]|eukprot:XP_014161032.1 hypothetical protein SARC_00753 [Sphaeroforma arctica JP610]
MDTSGDLWKTLQPFAYGGVSGMIATSCIQPVDLIKVRLQLTGEGGAVKSSNPFTMGAQIVRNDGVLSLYRGLSAGLLRQATYTTARMGIFKTLTEKVKGPDGKISFAQRVACSLTAGGLGATIGNPCDLALIRMQADSTLPAAERRGYKNVFDALAKIAKDDGILGWWRGCLPTVARAMALNCGMLATYDQSKETMTSLMGPGKATNFASSAVAGFFASFFSLPFDFVKTRMQKMKARPDGTMPYKNTLDCFAKVAKTEGPFAFYNGFMTYYFRIAPHAMITLLAVETLRTQFGDAHTK